MKLDGKQKQTLGSAALFLAVLATFAAAAVVSRRFFESPSRSEEPRHPQPQAGGVGEAASRFRVTAIEGPIEVSRNGQRYHVRAGDYISLQNVVRVPKEAKALLERGSIELTITEGDYRLIDVEETRRTEEEKTRLELLRGGGVRASVGDEAETLEISAGGTRAINRGVARWVVSRGPNGRVSVAASQGQVQFAAKGREVTVVQGTESTALPDQVPSEPENIPEALLLSVVWPEPTKTESRTDITGKVRPSSRVTVNGLEAPVAPDGTFTVPVPLSVGPNRVDVQAEDIAGRKKMVGRIIHRAARAPTLETSDEDLWTR